MGNGNLLETEFAGDFCHGLFVRGKTEAVHQHDSDSMDSGCACVGQHLAGLREIERRFDGTVRQHAFVEFGDARIQQLRLDDVAGEYF